MNPVIAEIYATGHVEDASGNQYPQNTAAISRESGQAIYEFLRSNQPKRTVEIGMAYGLSTLFICQALRDNQAGSHTAIDPFETTTFHSIGLLNIQRAGLDDLLRFLPRPSAQALPELLSEKESFDFALIDGSHLFDYALVDFFFIDQLLDPGGYVVFDDMWMPAVRKVLSFVLKNRAYKLVKPAYMPSMPFDRKIMRLIRRLLKGLDWNWRLLSLPHNMVFMQKTGPDTRDWDYHRRF